MRLHFPEKVRKSKPCLGTSFAFGRTKSDLTSHTLLAPRATCKSHSKAGNTHSPRFSCFHAQSTGSHSTVWASSLPFLFQSSSTLYLFICYIQTNKEINSQKISGNSLPATFLLSQQVLFLAPSVSLKVCSLVLYSLNMEKNIWKENLWRHLLH